MQLQKNQKKLYIHKSDISFDKKKGEESRSNFNSIWTISYLMQSRSFDVASTYSCPLILDVLLNSRFQIVNCSLQFLIIMTGNVRLIVGAKVSIGFQQISMPRKKSDTMFLTAEILSTVAP